MKLDKFRILFGSAGAILIAVGSAHADVIHTEILPSQLSSVTTWTDLNGNPVTPTINWTRPTTAAGAAAALTTYEEWDGFAAKDASNEPTGNSFFGPTLSPVPTAGDGAALSSGSFVIANGTATNAYYPGTQTGDIYSFSGVIQPQATIATYGAGHPLINVLVQVEADGAPIDPTQLSVNGVPASALANFSMAETYSDGGSIVDTPGGPESSYRNDYAWAFTVPDTGSPLELDFGWGPVSSSLVSMVVDTQAVPEPASLGLLGASALMLLARRRRRA